jgi:hypothetical protein
MLFDSHNVSHEEGIFPPIFKFRACFLNLRTSERLKFRIIHNKSIGCRRQSPSTPPKRAQCRLDKKLSERFSGVTT